MLNRKAVTSSETAANAARSAADTSNAGRRRAAMDRRNGPGQDGHARGYGGGRLIRGELAWSGVRPAKQR